MCPDSGQFSGHPTSDTAFLADTATATGLVAADPLSDLLHVTRGELALALGVPRESVTRTARARAPTAQARLRNLVEIPNRIRPWAGTPLAAFVWYRSQKLPSFGDQTAEALVKEGRAEAVKRDLDRIAVGGFA